MGGALDRATTGPLPAWASISRNRLSTPGVVPPAWLTSSPPDTVTPERAAAVPVPSPEPAAMILREHAPRIALRTLEPLHLGVNTEINQYVLQISPQKKRNLT